MYKTRLFLPSYYSLIKLTYKSTIAYSYRYDIKHIIINNSLFQVKYMMITITFFFLKPVKDNKHIRQKQ